jgi:EAL domain-containing protein (putative c-di-GMP-specific phosphodiesterase class I)
VAIYPQDGRTPHELLAHANFAMSNVKRTGRNNFCFYSDKMAVAVHHDFQLQAELRTALSTHQMEMFFQPQFEITGKTVLVGCEALMRWRLPDGSLRMPDKFIPLAERTGLIIPLGNQALELSCEAACRWHQRFGIWNWVGVNVSAIQFQQPDFVDNVARVIEKTGISPHALVLEVTESTAMNNAETTLQKFAQLNALGVRIAIDDFGTGYSSLAYLKRFKFHHIKIDRAFVNDLSEKAVDQHIVRAVIDLAHNFGVEAVAEGVERDDQHELLRRMGCCLAQGYLYGKPMPEADFVRLFLMHAANESAVVNG